MKKVQALFKVKNTLKGQLELLIIELQNENPTSEIHLIGSDCQVEKLQEKCMVVTTLNLQIQRLESMIQALTRIKDSKENSGVLMVLDEDFELLSKLPLWLKDWITRIPLIKKAEIESIAKLAGAKIETSKADEQKEKHFYINMVARWEKDIKIIQTIAIEGGRFEDVKKYL